MDKKEIKYVVSNSYLFHKVDNRQINKLIDVCDIKEYKNNEVVYKQGDPPDYFYLLIKGRAAVLTEINYKDTRIEILKRGKCFGIISLLTDDPHSVTVKSIEKTIILRVSKKDFIKFLENNSSVSLEISRILSQRVKSRSKPKKIFQSKKVAVLGNMTVGKIIYMLDLGLELKNQVKKDIISIQIICSEQVKSSFINERAAPIDDKTKILSLEDFKEENIYDYILGGKIDHLYIRALEESNFSSLLNFLSESYHFIVYNIPHAACFSHFKELTNHAHQLYILSFQSKEDLKETSQLIDYVKKENTLNYDKIRLVLVKYVGQKTISFDIKRRLLRHPIYAILPASESEEYRKFLRRFAREVGEVRVGIALGSGAAYGFSHIGVLDVLEKNNVDIDIVCGSSMGAVIGAFWAAGFSNEKIEKFAKEFAKKISLFSILGLSFPLKGIIKAKRLEAIFKKIFKDLTFQDLEYSLKIVTFDFLKRESLILEEGLLYKAVAASCAFPGIFEPIKVKEDILLDGGILNPLPAKVLLNYDTNKIIACDIMFSKEQALKEYKKRDRFYIFDFIFGSIETMQRQFVKQALEIADIIIHPNLEDLGWMEFDKILEFTQRGREAAQKKIEDIKELTFS